MMLLCFGGELLAPSLPSPLLTSSVLDVGCGAGDWAVAFARQNPKSAVSAFDLNPPTLLSKPSNLNVTAGNAEQCWPFTQQFDYIHVRLLTMAIRDWHAFLKRCYQHLKPGGWLELNDTSVPLGAENPRVNIHNSLMLRVSLMLQQGVLRNGISMQASEHHADRLKYQGFDFIQRHTVKWPSNNKWPKDPDLQNLGRLVNENWHLMARTGLRSILIGSLSMDPTEVDKLVEEVIEEADNDLDKKIFFPV